MSTRNFYDLLEARQKLGMHVCVGLDPDITKIPSGFMSNLSSRKRIVAFCKAVVDATKGNICAYKPNVAFFEAIGLDGYLALKEVINYILTVAPLVPIILDAKRGDIGNTNVGYVEMAFKHLGADAITVHGYMGKESLTPFLDEKDKGIFVLCRTSNNGAEEFQGLLDMQGRPLYQAVAHNVSTEWNTNNNCALVVGATAPKELVEIRQIVGRKMQILIPGIGAQGGDLETAIKAGGKNIIVNASRSILYPSTISTFDPVAVRDACTEMHEAICKLLPE